MENLLLKHPDLNDFDITDKKVYKVLDVDGNLVEYWEKNDNGNWIDMTEREKLKEQIAREQQELERLKKKETTDEDISR